MFAPTVMFVGRALARPGPVGLKPDLRSRALALCLAVLLSACTSQVPVLQVVDISVSPEPIVGQVVTVHVEVKSAEDEPDTTIYALLPRGVMLVGGVAEPTSLPAYGSMTRWQGSLKANQPQSYDFQVCVLYEGDWEIEVDASSQLTGGGYHADVGVIYLVSTASSGKAVPSWKYDYKPSPKRNTPLPETPPAGICP